MNRFSEPFTESLTDRSVTHSLGERKGRGKEGNGARMLRIRCSDGCVPFPSFSKPTRTTRPVGMAC